MRCILYSLYTFITGKHLCYALYAQARLDKSPPLDQHYLTNNTSPPDLQVGKVGTGRGRKRKSGEQASTKDLQLAGILHIMFLLANDEVTCLCNMGSFDRHRLNCIQLMLGEHLPAMKFALICMVL